jgi:Mg2+/Co2+ transporter CorB
MMESSLFLTIIFIFILLLMSAFFSSSETGLTAASKARIHKLITGGNKRAKLVSKLRDDKEGLIGTLLLGNNAVNILASALATSLAINLFGDEGVVYATIIMTILVLIFAEVMPKTYAFYNSEKVALAVAPILNILVKICYPFTRMVQLIVTLFMKIIGVSKDDIDPFSAVDELRGAIDMHHMEGSVVKGEKDMLRSILDLSNMEVEEIMIHRKNIYSIDINQPARDIITTVLDSKYTRIPLWEERPDNIIGVLHVKLLIKALRSYEGDVDKLDIRSIASKPWFVPETNSVRNQLFQFRQKRNHIAIVVDEYGDLIGLITLEDILEEIVGKIDEENGSATNVARKLVNGNYRVNGDVTIRDLNRQLEWNLPDERATTVAGLIINETETIPEVGQEFEFYGFWFKIEKKKQNQIFSILVKKIIKKK